MSVIVPDADRLPDETRFFIDKKSFFEV